MDVKCPGCYKITTVFSHAQSVVICTGCSTILCQPTGGRARLTEGKTIFKVYFLFCQTIMSKKKYIVILRFINYKIMKYLKGQL